MEMLLRPFVSSFVYFIVRCPYESFVEYRDKIVLVVMGFIPG